LLYLKAAAIKRNVEYEAANEFEQFVAKYPDSNDADHA
jgi:TolA-binding protein